MLAGARTEHDILSIHTVFLWIYGPRDKHGREIDMMLSHAGDGFDQVLQLLVEENLHSQVLPAGLQS